MGKCQLIKKLYLWKCVFSERGFKGFINLIMIESLRIICLAFIFTGRGLRMMILNVAGALFAGFAIRQGTIFTRRASACCLLVWRKNQSGWNLSEPA
jgi:hypothetical protein